jgi:hypothetical protein
MPINQKREKKNDKPKCKRMTSEDLNPEILEMLEIKNKKGKSLENLSDKSGRNSNR